MYQIIRKTVFSMVALLFISSNQSVFGFEKLASKYTPSFGDPKAPVYMIEYFSFGCQKCLNFINHDFLQVKTELIDTGKVFWTFHPDPADLLTLQLMICLEKLTNEEKGEFFLLASRLAAKSPKRAVKWMKESLKFKRSGGAEYLSLPMIEKAAATKAAMEYLKQADAPTLIPTLEVNGELKNEFPTISMIKSLINTKEHSCNLKN